MEFNLSRKSRCCCSYCKLFYFLLFQTLLILCAVLLSRQLKMVGFGRVPWWRVPFPFLPPSWFQGLFILFWVSLVQVTAVSCQFFYCWLLHGVSSCWLSCLDLFKVALCFLLWTGFLVLFVCVVELLLFLFVFLPPVALRQLIPPVSLSHHTLGKISVIEFLVNTLLSLDPPSKLIFFLCFVVLKPPCSTVEACFSPFYKVSFVAGLTSSVFVVSMVFLFFSIAAFPSFFVFLRL